MRPSRIAPMNRRLTLQAPQETDDGAGGMTLAWRDVATLWAAIRPHAAAEGLWASQPAARLSSEITIRYRDDVWPEMRFVSASGRIFDIRAAFDPDGSRRRLVCLCGEEPL